MNPSNLIFDEDLIKEKLFHFDSPLRSALKDDFFINSAVLFAIIPYENKPYELILIHRTDRGSNHRGEMSFPGGKFDAKLDRSLQYTVLRETEEEIGIPKSKIKLLGCLNDVITLTKFIITPFIGIVDKDQKLFKDNREVQEIVKVPINFFFSKKNFSEEFFYIGGKKFPVLYFNYETNNKKYTIWGATAFMIASFINIVYDTNLSNLKIRRFTIEELKPLKNYIEIKNKIWNPDK
ncbi:MAG: NUDIX hydrolase [Promethearchaeota archaeon]